MGCPCAPVISLSQIGERVLDSDLPTGYLRFSLRSVLRARSKIHRQSGVWQSIVLSEPPLLRTGDRRLTMVLSLFAPPVISLS